MNKIEFTDHIFIDTETTKLENILIKEFISFPYLMGFTVGDGGFVPAMGEEVYTVFMKKVEDMLRQSKNKSITMGAFNAYYDIVTLKPLFDKYWKGKIDLYLDHRKKFIYGDYSLILDGIKYKIKFEDYWIFNRNMSIDAWSKLLEGRGKRPFDYDKWGPVWRKSGRFYYKNHRGEEASSSVDEELTYLMEDVLILPKIKSYIKQFKEKAVEITGVDESLAEELNIKQGMTAASFSKYIASLKMKQNFDDVFRPTVCETVYRFLQRSFMGGYTVGNKDVHKVDLGEENYGIIGLDVNSMYPYIISKGLPVGRLLKEKIEGGIEWVVICTKDPKLKEKYSFLSDLPIKQELTDGKAWCCLKEFYLVIQEMFETKIVVKDYLYSKPNLKISTLVKDLYKKRKDPNTDNLTADTIKIVLNSLYGKTCEKTRETHYTLTNEGLTKGIVEEPDFRSTLTGIYITNVARLMAFKAITQIVKDGNIFLYTDTDSAIFVANNIYKFDIGDDLGQWKIEGKYNYFSRPQVKKKYLLEGINSKGEKGIKVAVSGFDKQIVMENMTKEQRRLLFSKDVNVLWRRAKSHSALNSMSQIIIDAIDVVTNEAIPITHEMVFVNGKIELIAYEKQ